MQVDNEVKGQEEEEREVSITNFQASLKEWLCLQIWSMLARLTSLTLLKFSIIQHFIYIDCQVAICLTSIKRKPHIAFIKD